MSNILHSQEHFTDVLRHVARNVRGLRVESGLSQQDLAERAGISRRMLVSVEAGDVNISLGKLDAIAIALGVSFTRIVSNNTPPSPAGEIMWRGKSQSSHAVLVGTVPVRHEVEFWLWSLDVGAFYQGEPDPKGYQEALILQDGELSLTVEGEGERRIATGTFTLFDSNKPYRYTNVGSTIVRFLRAVLN